MATTVFQLLLYPVVALALVTDSYAQLTKGVPLTTVTMCWFVEHHAPAAEQRLVWHASPLLVESLAGAPPALVLTVAYDPLADEGRVYAA